MRSGRHRLIGSFRPSDDILSTMSPLSWQLLIPSHVTLDNYSRLLVDSGFAHALLNSAFVCIASVVVGLLVSSMAAYTLAVFHFPGRNLVFALVVISFMVPFEAIAIPLSQQFISWGLGNSLVGLILPGNILGLFLLLALLGTGAVPLRWVAGAARWLLWLLPLLFMPIFVYALHNRDFWVADRGLFAGVVAVATLLLWAAAGHLAQWTFRKQPPTEQSGAAPLS